MRKHTFTIGLVSIVIFSLGVIFKFTHLPGAGFLMMIGLLGFLFGFIVSFFIDKVTVESRRQGRMSLVLLLSTLFVIFVSAIFQIFHYPGSSYLGYGSLVMIMIFMVFFSKQLEGRQLNLRRDRQLAAIMFTDIVGYTKLMGSDERKTLTFLNENRKIQKRLARKYRGKWLKEMGDGTLLIFYTASEAVLCALEMQEEINKAYAFKIRIGIHLSEIVFTDDDIYGDGVNVAARISALAGAAEIWFSDSVYQNVRNREELTIAPQGKKELKHVEYALDLFKIDA